MSQRGIHPSYYDDAISGSYPFASDTSRSNATVVVEDDVFVDARFFNPAGNVDLYLSKISIADVVALTIADSRGEIATAEFVRSALPDTVHFWRGDKYIGLLQFHPGQAGTTATEGDSETAAVGAAKLCSWVDGTYAFTAAQTRFTASVVTPQPQVCVRDFLLPAGDLFSDEVVLVGERGVQLTVEPIAPSDSSSSGTPEMAIRVDIVGDPLRARRQCNDVGAEGPGSTFLRAIEFDGQLITPSADGSVRISVNDSAGAITRPALRVQAITTGIEIGFVSR